MKYFIGIKVKLRYKTNFGINAFISVFLPIIEKLLVLYSVGPL